MDAPGGNPPDIPTTLVEQLSKARRRGTKGDELTGEIHHEKFLRLMQAQVDNGSSTVKAMMSVMQEWNVSLDDIQKEYRKPRSILDTDDYRQDRWIFKGSIQGRCRIFRIGLDATRSRYQNV